MSKPFSNVGGQGNQESNSIEADFVRRTHHEGIIGRRDIVT